MTDASPRLVRPLTQAEIHLALRVDAIYTFLHEAGYSLVVPLMEHRLEPSQLP
jgi:hypothetical protein